MGSIRKWRQGEWQIDYRRQIDGQYFGRKEVIKGTKAYAQEVLRQRDNEVDRFIRLGEQPGDRVALLMDDVLDGLIEFYKLKNRKSVDRAERSVAKLKEYFSGQRADRVIVDDVEKWRRWRYDQPTQRGGKPMPATVNRELAALKTAFSRAIKNRKLDHNPALYVELDDEKNERMVMWTDDQFRAVWEIAKPYQRVILGLLRFCGLRKQEALTARFDRVDRNGLLEIPPEFDKAGRGRKVPIPPQLLLFIRNQKAPNQTHLVWYRRGPITSIRGTIIGLTARAGIEQRLWAHDFRRSLDHHCRRTRIDERIIRAILGHSQGSDAHARYVVVEESDLVAAGRRIGEGLLDELMAGEIVFDNAAPSLVK